MSKAFVSGGEAKSEWRYGWRKNPYSISAISNTSAAVRAGGMLYYSDTITFDEDTKIATLNNPVSIIASNNIGLNLAGKYVGTNKSAVLSESVGTSSFGIAKGTVKMWEYSGAWYGFDNMDSLLISVGTIPACVVDDNENAYPSNGYKDGYKYVAVVT